MIAGASNPVTASTALAPASPFEGDYLFVANASSGPMSGILGMASNPHGWGVYGLAFDGTGVQGDADGAQASGVVGTGFYGVAGYGDYAGVYARPEPDGAGMSGLVAYAVAGNAVTAVCGGSGYAAQLYGKVLIEGPLRVRGSFTVEVGPKGAVVPHPDGTHRLLYCMESPDCWFEDFGEGALAKGQADVALDPDFAAVVEAERYHVFLTPHGDCRGLYVAQRSPTGFTVCEQQGGRSSVTFSYRVAARRKDLKAERLAKFDEPVPEPPDPNKIKPPMRKQPSRSPARGAAP
jgi:hypothetical protein